MLRADIERLVTGLHETVAVQKVALLRLSCHGTRARSEIGTNRPFNLTEKSGHFHTETRSDFRLLEAYSRLV